MPQLLRLDPTAAEARTLLKSGCASAIVKRIQRKNWATLLGAAVASGAVAILPAAAATADQPRPWQIGMQAAASPVQERIESLHNELLIIISLIVVFVLSLL